MPQPRWHLWLLVTITAIVYCPILTNEFVGWDDGQTIYQNPRTNPPTLANTLWYWAHPENGEYLPLTRTVWAALAVPARLSEPDELGSTLNPWLYHAASLLAHILSAILVYLILLHLLKHGWPAVAGALLFALHPVQVESVAWASGLKDLLFALFALAAVLSYLRFCDSPRSRWKWYLMGFLALLASILSKPMGVVTPALAAAIGWLLLGRPLRRILAELWPWFALSLLFGLLARHWMPSEGIPTAPLWARPLIAGDSLAFYVWKLTWPASLGIDYGRTPAYVVAHGWAYLTAIVPLALGVILWRWRKAAPIACTGAVVAVLAMAPVIGLLPHMFQYYSTTADHYLYLPLFGVAMIAAWALTRLSPRNAAALSAAVLLVLGVRSMMQTLVWSSNVPFWEHQLAVNPRSYLALDSLAEHAMATGDLAGAGRLLDRALQANPDYHTTHSIRARLAVLQKDIDAAILHFERSLAIRETFPEGHRTDMGSEYRQLGEILAARGRWRDAAEKLRMALRYRPGDPAIQAALENTLARAATRPATLPAR